MDNRHPIPETANAGAGCFKEAVCINAERIYDSCSEHHHTGWKRTSPVAKKEPPAVVFAGGPFHDLFI